MRNHLHIDDLDLFLKEYSKMCNFQNNLQSGCIKLLLSDCLTTLPFTIAH